MTKAYAAKKRNPIPPTREAIRTAHVLDAVLELRPLKPPGNPKCRICRDLGCRMCGKMPERKRDSHCDPPATLWQKRDR